MELHGKRLILDYSFMYQSNKGGEIMLHSIRCKHILQFPSIQQ